MRRRDFVKGIGAAGAVASLIGSRALAAEREPISPTPRSTPRPGPPDSG